MQSLSAPVISIGCQAGGSEARVPRELKVPLYQALARHVTSSHCSAIDEYALVLRIDGSLDKYGEPGIQRLRFVRSKRYISVDIQISEPVWQPLTLEELRVHIASEVRLAIMACAERLKRDGFVVADHELFAQFDAAAREFLSSDATANYSLKSTPLCGAA